MTLVMFAKGDGLWIVFSAYGSYRREDMARSFEEKIMEGAGNRDDDSEMREIRIETRPKITVQGQRNTVLHNSHHT